MRRYGIPTVEREVELLIAQWAQLGYGHPRVSQYKHGKNLNQLENGRYSANIIGFILVGKFGDPDLAFQQLEQVGGRYWELLGLTQQEVEPIDDFAADQDIADVGTETFIHDLLNVQHFEIHSCAEGEWNLSDYVLRPGAVVLLPVSGQAKEWLTLATMPQNTALRNVRVNDLETGRDDCQELRLCTNSNNELAIFVHYSPVGAEPLDLRIWWLNRMLNMFMPQRIAKINSRLAA